MDMSKNEPQEQGERRCPKCYHGRGVTLTGQCAAISDRGYYFCSCQCEHVPAPAPAVKAVPKRIYIDLETGDWFPERCGERPELLVEYAPVLPARDTVGVAKSESGHHLPNWLWCERCQGWIETAHQCGAQYLDKGTHFELVREAAPDPSSTTTPPAPAQACTWTFDGSDGAGQWWRSGCDGCRKRRHPMYEFCPYCGLRLETKEGESQAI